MIAWLYPIAAAFALSALLCLLVRQLALSLGWVALPSGDRWNQRTVALYGGVGIVGAFLAVWAGGAWLLELPWQAGALWLVGGAALSLLCGLLDDRIDLRPSTKIVFQVVAASFLVAGADWVIPLTPRFLINTLLTIFWVVGLMNALNLLDGMDGLAGGVAAIAAVGLLLLLPADGETPTLLALGLCAFLGALLGFLVFNVQPASLFMGDTGSLPVGYVLAAFGVAAAGGPGAEHAQALPPVSWLLPLLLPVLILSIPIFDTSFVFLSRKWYGVAATIGGKDHTFYRVARLGVSERLTVAVFYALGALGAGAALLTVHQPLWGYPLAGMYLLLLALMGVYLARIPVYEAQQHPRRPRALLPSLINYVLVRRNIAAMGVDVLLIGMAYYASFLLRFEGSFGGELASFYGETLAVIIPLAMVYFQFTGLYRQVWSGISMADMRLYFLTFLFFPLLPLAYLSYLGFPHALTLVLIFDMLLAGLVLGSRVFFRVVDQLLYEMALGSAQPRLPLLLYGAGQHARMAIEEVRRDPERRFRVLGLIDDNPDLMGRRAWGLRVLGRGSDLPRLVRKHGVRHLMVTTPGVDMAGLREGLRAEGLELELLLLRITWEPVAPGDEPGTRAG